LIDVTVGLRRPDAHLSSSDGDDDWQAIDNVSVTAVCTMS